jgi:N-acylglucosamine 2-epimerase
MSMPQESPPARAASEPQITHPPGRAQLQQDYRRALLEDVIPFWLKHGLDREHGGILTCLDRDGSVLDTDKSVWFQGRAGWMFATLYNTVERRPEWLEAARSCVEFSRRHCFAPNGKMYFSVTRDGRPLRMRRYVFSESFAAIANAAYFKATGDSRAAEDAVKTFATYLRYSFTPGVMPPKFEPTRPMQSLGPRMICIATAQELRANLGDVTVAGRTCTEWIDESLAEIERHFLKPDQQALLEVVGPNGEVLDHSDGRTLNPGHALECAWFILHEGNLRRAPRLIRLGCTILDWMWARGWDAEYGGIFYFRDLRGLPVQEYWHDMKFWWPHNEAVIATFLTWSLTRDPKYAQWHQQVHDWSFSHFPDAEYGEWYGYLHRDGTIASRAKGSLYKGPFHLPRMLWYCWKLTPVLLLAVATTAVFCPDAFHALL